MPLTPGARLGHYDVTALIGEGGMGQVYRATDTTLNRQVALKILPEAFAADPDRIARFQREAHVLASLNHSNIAAIYGIEEAEGTKALVLELVEGLTLADRIAQGAIPLDEALPIAKQIAGALEVAHEAGVIHRDLKPANIKVREDGTVKVLDFGLAKALDTTPQGDPSLSPTLSAAVTQMGVIMGTAAYMSPEQARGKVVDKRADIWSFGVVLYEMLTGQRAFQGEDVSLTLSAVLEREPEWAGLPPTVPAGLNTYLRRCLQKDPRKRVQAIGDVRLALEGAFESATTDVAAMAVARPAWRRAVPVAIAASVATAVILGLAAWSVWPSPQVGSSADVVRFQLDLAPGQHLSGGVEMEETSASALQRPSRPSFALSPDGQNLVYAASDGETTRLYRRPMDQDQATPIPGTDGGSSPFFAPFGESVGFRVGGELKRVPIDGGDVRSIAASGPLVAAFSWTEDDTILVQAGDAIYAVPAIGGSLARLTQVDRAEGERAHRYAQMLPGERAVLFNVATESEVPSDWTIVVQSVESGDRQTVVEGGSAPRYLPSGHIVFARSGTLMAVPFDADRLEVTGDPVVVLEDVMHGERGGNSSLNHGAAQFSVSNTGSLTYVPGGIYPDSAFHLVLVNRRGEAETLPLPPVRYLWPRFSPDGTRLSYSVGITGSGDTQLWVYDLGLALPRALTSTGANTEAVWSPDSTRLVFSRRGADGGLFSIAADGSGAPERVGENLSGRPSAWSKDNVLAFLHSPGPGEPQGIWTLRMDGARQPEPFVATASSFPDFSPDGRWITYVEGGEVYVRPFPAGAPVERVSPDGGRQPVWSPDGRQLFYTKSNPDTRTVQVMVVDVVTELAFRPSPPRPLYEGRYSGTIPIRSFDISPAGARFVMTKPLVAEPQPVTSIRVVQHWFEELNRLVPVP